MSVSNNPPPNLYEELPEWYIRQREEEQKQKEEAPQLEFNIPFGWTE